jgi:hypothetical protein
MYPRVSFRHSFVSAGKRVTYAAVDVGKRGLLYVDGRLVRELGAGTWALWSVVVTPTVEVLETPHADPRHLGPGDPHEGQGDTARQRLGSRPNR